MNRSTRVTFLRTCLSACPISLSMYIVGSSLCPIGSGLPALAPPPLPPADGGTSSSASTGVPDEGVSRFGRSPPKPRGPYGSSSSTMQRCTRLRSPSYATTTSPLKKRPVTESLMGSDMNIGDG
ncbi:hypothetical protein GSI_14096 [Ganoderma sinense ZZ0214-1]|uniref:Uncharacterized protein n=1 Tax=Ganoderma sinense ZZ0214-1 TaxID=1077348 RepID=A0A2G8RS73_9APHY|nr:hypothetical protein GSI_14096 [Ganoderma sinense ZZ0214-1]